MVTDCAAEIAAVDVAISALGADGAASTAARRAALLYRKACLTGRTEAYRSADHFVDGALAEHPRWPDLWMLKATLDLHFHRFADALRHLDALPGLASTPEALVLAGDVELHVGHRAAARLAFQAAANADPRPGHLVRLAACEEVAGRPEAADALFAEAEDGLTAKEMRTFAWLQLRRGSAACVRGDHAAAERFYARADAAYSGYWLVRVHQADLAAAEGETARAATLYEDLARSVGRPEFDHRLGDVLAATDPARARASHERALAGYRASIARGEVHELHRAAVLYLDVCGDAASATECALADLALRRSPVALRTAARCLAAAGRTEEARRLEVEADDVTRPAVASTSGTR